MAWIIDVSHSGIQFSVKHLGISTARGTFTSFTGTIDADEQNPTAAKVDVQIETASINTRDEKRDAHLRSPDFFDVDTYPTLTFKSTRVEQLDASNGKLYGDLTIKDITKPVVLNFEFAGLAKSPWGTTSAGFSAETKINRKDWNLNWNVALEAGGWLVGEEVKIAIELELLKQVEQPEAAAAV
ncbi:MAG: YceI family protein [Kouleothrix sp.]|jgi:polyisoprenoid-binding protein YceI|nr:YceI family protein [Kouleothrix sp.]